MRILRLCDDHYPVVMALSQKVSREVAFKAAKSIARQCPDCRRLR